METSNPTLKIARISSFDQLDQLIDLACDTFINDPLFSLIVPGRHEHPESFRGMWSMHLSKAYGERGTVILAAYRERGGERTEFLAFAVWRRHGTSDVAQSWQGDTWNKKFTRLGVMWSMFFKFILRIPAPGVSLDDAIEVVTGLQEAEKLYPPERWRLCWLAVSPKCQRTGIGRRLVQWGVDRCEEEGVPAVLESSIPGKPLYEKMGFREIGQARYDKGRRAQPVMLRPVEETKKTV
ncbi:hypothetical protein ACHAP8_012220 [Fusarium lateritium]